MEPASAASAMVPRRFRSFRDGSVAVPGLPGTLPRPP